MSITQEQPRAIIFYEWHAAAAAAHNINRRLSEGTTTGTGRIAKRWCARFASGDTDFEDNPGQSPPGPRLQQSAISMDPSHLDGWHSVYPGIHLRPHQKKFLDLTAPYS
ncbi:hypothetical protein RB195_015938 [Necator americanus]|uniref:Mos1 transposase HTH domain-containing protein n=1 Tax=Necator americanus TaxID=51031 RepID=A0ABR1E6Y8_NECAM